VWDEAESWHDSEPRHEFGRGYYFPFASRVVHGKKIPQRVVMCYTDWMQCDEKVLESAKGGGCNGKTILATVAVLAVNTDTFTCIYTFSSGTELLHMYLHTFTLAVLVWSFINFRRVQSDSGDPGAVEVTGGPNPECFRRVASELAGSGWEVVHLASVGGWNQGHPDGITAGEALEAFHAWNTRVVADVVLGVAGFDGVDWDIEGADDGKSPANTMSISVLDLIGGFASLARNLGYFSTLSAPESYLDPLTSGFDRELTHTYPEWREAGVDFARHGRNCLAYVVAAYGDAFDLVSLQLYESFSHADFAITQRGLDPGSYLAQYMHRLSRGWRVDFSADRALALVGAAGELHVRPVRVPRDKLVLGFANAWAGRGQPGLCPPAHLPTPPHPTPLLPSS